MQLKAATISSPPLIKIRFVALTAAVLYGDSWVQGLCKRALQKAGKDRSFSFENVVQFKRASELFIELD